MKVACVLVTHLRAKVELRRQPHLQATPAVIVDRSGGRPVVVDALPATAGVTPGMTLEEALSRHTNTTILEADEPAYQRVYQQVLTSLQGVSDRVEGPEPGTAYIRLDGLEELYGGEPRLVSALLNSVPEYLGPRVGVGHAKFPAFVAALDQHGPRRRPGPRGRGCVPGAPPRRPPPPPRGGHGGHAAPWAAHHGGRGRRGGGPADRSVRAGGQEGVGALPRRRRQPPGPPQTRGVHHGARRPPLLLRLPGAPGDNGGHPAPAGLLAAPDGGPARGQGGPGVRPLRGAPLAADGPLQGRRGELGAGLLSSSGTGWRRTIPGPPWRR